MVGLVEHHRPGHQELGVGVGVVGRVDRLLGRGDVAGVLHEPAELGVGDGVLVDPEAVERDRVHRRLLRGRTGRTP